MTDKAAKRSERKKVSVASERRASAEMVTTPSGQKAPLRYEAGFPDAANPDREAAKARLALAPSGNAAVIAHFYTGWVDDLHVGEVMKILSERTREMQAGDMKHSEAMLLGQAEALAAIFYSFARRAKSQTHVPLLEALMRMALKAQNQCRMTLETLSAIKNPPTVFARQANINNGGQQQVNNGAAVPQNADDRARTSEGANRKTELLEATDGQRMDAAAAGTTGGADPRMEPVAKVHRPAHG